MSKDESYKEKILKMLKDLKSEKKNLTIPVYDNEQLIASLQIASASSLNNEGEIKNLAKWREMHSWWFPAQFKVTVEGTRKWFLREVLKKEDRLLFIVETASGIPFGHMGLYRFDFAKRSCEIDNVVRGEDHLPGAMTPSLKTLIDWAFSTLQVDVLYLQVFSDNARAIELYKRCGFQEVKKIPLKKVEEADRISWLEQEGKEKTERYFTRMKLDKHAYKS